MPTVPIPGTTHLYRLTTGPHSPVAAPQRPIPRPRPAPSPNARRRTSYLIAKALDVAFGIRPVHHLTQADFSATARLQLTHQHSRNPVRGPVSITSLHRLGTEVFGTAQCCGERFAYCATLTTPRSQEPEKILAFRALVPAEQRLMRTQRAAGSLPRDRQRRNKATAKQ